MNSATSFTTLKGQYFSGDLEFVGKAKLKAGNHNQPMLKREKKEKIKKIAVIIIVSLVILGLVAAYVPYLFAY